VQRNAEPSSRPRRPLRGTLLGIAAALLLAAGGAAAQETAPTPPLASPRAEPGELFIAANTAYEAGDHPRAIALYRQILALGVENGHLYYNLGNACLRNGELGQAVAAYRRSRSLLPRDEDVAANLAFARASARDAVPPSEPSPVVRNLFFWHYSLSRPELLRLVVLLNLAFWVLAAARLFAPRSRLLRWSLGAVLTLLLATGASLALRFAAPLRVAVIVPPEVDVYAGIREDAVVRFELHAGSEVRATGLREGWVRIALPGGEQGWLPEDQVEVVTE